MASQLIQLLQALTDRVNRGEEHRRFVAGWVGPYQGKVIQLETDEGTHHIILKRDGTMTLREGPYPSPDVIYKAKAQTLLEVFTGRADPRNLMKSWKLLVMGAGHESLPLAQLMRNILTSTQ